MELTERKKNVLNLLCKGKRAEEIAHELKISLSAVRLHIRELKLKFNASTLAELVFKALKQNVI